MLHIYIHNAYYMVALVYHNLYFMKVLCNIY